MKYPFAPGVIDHQGKRSSLLVDLAIAIALMAVALVVGFSSGYIPRWLA